LVKLNGEYFHNPSDDEEKRPLVAARLLWFNHLHHCNKRDCTGTFGNQISTSPDRIKREGSQHGGSPVV